MLKVRIIPCMLYNGFQVVKTIQFDAIRNLGPAVQFAKVYNQRNVDELIFIDFTATAENRQPVYEVIQDVFNECFMPLTVGGGIHSMDQVDKLINIGADKVCINSQALEQPSFITKIAEKYGSQAVVVSIDAKKIDGQYMVMTERGQKNTGKKINNWLAEIEKYGAGEVLLTSIDNDGMMQGYDLDLIKQASQNAKIPIIACGGAGKVQDVIDAVKLGGADAVAIASMFHYTGHTPNSIKERMSKADIPVRLMRENYEN